MKTVIGVFADEPYAQEAMGELEARGFSPEDISVIMKDNRVDGGVSTTKDYGTSMVKGATSGIATGAVLGGIAGLLVGIGALAIPGVGAFLVGGPLAAAVGLTGAAATTVTGAATGAVAGGLVGTLTGLGLTKEQAVAYEEQIKEGAILMAVPVSADYESDVRAIMDRFNATDVTSVLVPSDRFRSRNTEQFADDDLHDTDRDLQVRDRDEDAAERDRGYDRPYATAGMKGGRSMLRTTRSRRERNVRTRHRRVL